MDGKIFQAFLLLLHKWHKITPKIINSEIISICSSNEISSIKMHMSTIYGFNINPHNDLAPSLPDSSTGRALHQHCRGQGSSAVQAFPLLLLKQHNVNCEAH